MKFDGGKSTQTERVSKKEKPEGKKQEQQTQTILQKMKTSISQADLN